MLLACTREPQLPIQGRAVSSEEQLDDEMRASSSVTGQAPRSHDVPRLTGARSLQALPSRRVQTAFWFLLFAAPAKGRVPRSVHAASGVQ